MTQESKNKLFGFLGLFAAMVLIGFAVFGLERLLRPNANDQRAHGEVSVYIPASVASSVAQNTVRELSRLGPTFRQVFDSSAADVVVVTEMPTTCTSAGYHRLGTSVATVNITCTHSPEMLQLAMMHEIGHVLGMTHVCKNAITTEQCSPVGYGPSMMNPVIEEGWTDDSVPNSGIQYEITSLDIQEYRRTRTRN
jgi:hypothetical protein